MEDNSRRKDEKKKDKKYNDKKSKHSRSRSRNRKHKRSRSRSARKERSREKKRNDSPKKSQKQKGAGCRFDSPPKDFKKDQDILQTLGGGGMPFLSNPVFGGGDLMQRMQMMTALQAIQNSKVDRKLYVGNIPQNITPTAICDLLNSALQKMGINTEPPGSSITSAWIAADGHYAFVEFRTPEEANNGFNLNNVAIHGQPLKIGRPKTYAAHQATTQNLGPASLFNNDPFAVSSTQPEDQIQKVQLPSRILILKNMLTMQDLEIDEEFQELYEDIKQECSQHGQVISIKIPRPMQGLQVPGLGRIFVEYATIEQSIEAKKSLNGRTFDNKTVECSYLDEANYKKNDLEC